MTAKNCTKCKELKPLSEFYRNKNYKDGLQYECKPCQSVQNKIYFHTKTGLISRIYNHQKNNSINRGHQKPCYSLDELRKFALSNPEFNELYDKWVAGGHKKELSPSFDRLDDYKGYSFDNIRAVTWQENEAKGHADRRNGVNNKGSKSIIQMTKSGALIAKYHSARHASRVTGVANSHISNCCSGKEISAGGFIWEFAK